MEIKKGRTRVVLLFPVLRIALKLPIIRVELIVKNLFRFIRLRRWKQLKLFFLWSMSKTDQCFKWFAFSGVVANWNEFIFYAKKRNVLLQPTYFSLFGLINIQRYDNERCEMNGTDLYCQIHELTDGKSAIDRHHFFNSGNYCYCHGRLRLVDYGSKNIRPVIQEYGAKIVEQFNPHYNWSEVCAKRMVEKQLLNK